MTTHTHPEAEHPSDQSHGRLRDGIDSSRDKAREAARQTVEAIDSNPLGVIVGGVALGALVGAILPRSQREKELLAPVGQRVNAAALAAVAAAREAGQGELSNLGLTKGAATDQAKALFQNIARAATTAGKAGLDAGRQQVRGTTGGDA